jgi:formylmethanofuran dehydrogenase subunit B
MSGTNSQDPGPAAAAPLSDFTCLGCGCFCDDVLVSVGTTGRPDFRSHCDLGRTWLEGVVSRDPGPEALILGRPATVDEALAHAATLLLQARSPVVFGLTRTVTEAAREAIRLAESIGGRVVLDRTRDDLGRVASFQALGRVSSTLGEVKNRADLVVFWRSDPVRTHPRHMERYSVAPSGRFLPRGTGGRTVIVVNPAENSTATCADLQLVIPEDRDLEALLALRALVLGKPIDQTSLRSVGLDPEALERLAQRFQAARYGAFFLGGSGHARCGPTALWEGATKLVRALNHSTRFVLLGMGSARNVAGAEAVLAWRAGYAQGVDFRPGYPIASDDMVTLDEVLASREPDAVVSIGSPWPDGLSDSACAHLSSIPRVMIGCGATSVEGPSSTVAVATSAPGVESGGTVFRADGVAIPTRPVLNPGCPSDLQALQRLIRLIENGPGGGRS